MIFFTWIGRLLVLLSFIFIIQLFIKVDWDKIWEFANIMWIFTFLISILIYIFATYLLSINWKNILEKFSAKPLPNEVVYTYLETVIFKYIPGNIFHFAGRHKLEKSLSLARNNIVISNGIEIILQALSAFLLLIFLHQFIDLTHVSKFINQEYIKYGFIAAILLSIGLMTYLYEKYFIDKKIIDVMIFLSKLIVNYSIFLLFSSLVLILMLSLFYEYSTISDFIFILFYINTVAWIAGYVIPGAPGGIGIRESIILFPLISLGLNNDIVLMSVMLQRLVMIVSEVLIYIWIQFFIHKKAKV